MEVSTVSSDKMMDATLASVLVVNVVGLLTLLVTTIAAAQKAKAERMEVAEALERKSKDDDERAARDRKWAQEDREAIAAKVAADALMNQLRIESRIDNVGEKADLAYREANTVNIKIAEIGLKAANDKKVSEQDETIRAP